MVQRGKGVEQRVTLDRRGIRSSGRCLTVNMQVRYRRSTPELNLISPQNVPSFFTVAGRRDARHVLQNVCVYLLGADSELLHATIK